MRHGIPTGFKLWFAFCALFAIGIFAWNIYVYQDCRAHGNPAYKCQAMLSAQGVIVDDME
jgi:hypothetical protein